MKIFAEKLLEKICSKKILAEKLLEASF